MELSARTDVKSRYYLLDSVRGICILGMIAYHTLFDIVAFFGVPVSAGLMTAVDVVRDFGACCFICLSGICMHFGRRPVKRLLLITGASLIISAVTYIVMPDVPVIFGILTFMAFASLIMIPLKKHLDKLPAVPSAAVCFIMFLLTFEIYHNYVGFYSLKLFDMPEFLYRNYFTAALGFPFEGFASSDYYPVFPWIFMFLFGFFLWKIMKRSRGLMKIMGIRIRPLEKIGQLSLYIYVLHQPVVLGILLLVFKLLGY